MKSLHNTKSWTFGVEHEFADIDRSIILPQGCQHNKKDYTIVNSNGIANDPTDRLYKFGGEVNTRPTSKILEQVKILEEILVACPEIAVNYRSNLHIHVRVPGLCNDLILLKALQTYIHTHMPIILPIIEPIPAPQHNLYRDPRSYAGAMRRFRRRKVSHHTLLSKKRLDKQLATKSCKEFFMAEVPHRENGTPCWHLQPRCCVNIRQLNETNTIEFRHWPGTLDGSELFNCIEWCRRFLQFALASNPVEQLLAWMRPLHFPTFPEYNHDLEVKYRATCHDGSLKDDEIVTNIKAIEAGKFDVEEYQAKKEMTRAKGFDLMSWK